MPVQTPGEVRPGSFKGATETRMLQAPAGQRQRQPLRDGRAKGQEQRHGAGLAPTQPLLPWGHPDHVGKGPQP